MLIELRHLRHLLALAEHGHFGRAAAAVHLTQPALSRSLQAIEASVGAALFERRRGAIEPTEIGQLLLRHAQALDASSRDLEREIRLTKGLELGELRIGVGPFGGSALVGPVVGRLNRLHPGLRIGLVVAPWQELPGRARAREVDLVVAELSEIEALDDFETQALAAHTACVVCRPGHPLTQSARPRPQQLFDYPLAGPRMPARALRALAAMAPPAVRARLRRSDPGALQAIECDSSTILKSILKESDAVSMMPRFMVEADVQSGQLAMIGGIALDVPARFGAAWLKHRSLSGAATRFVALLREHDQALARPAPAAQRRTRSAQE